jgi:hydrogenase 3 maturation protease
MATKPMLQSFWKSSLIPILSPEQSQFKNSPARIAIVGIGNEFNGDDAAGVLVARGLNSRECATDAQHVIVIEAGQAPENITAELRRFEPQVVVLIDAALMDADPGDVIWIPWETTSGMSACSHSLPLSMLARYLTLEFTCTVHLLGIQPAHNDPERCVSPAVQAAIDDICRTLCQALFVVPDAPCQELGRDGYPAV